MALQHTLPLVKFAATVLLLGLNIHSTKLTIHTNSVASWRALSTSSECTVTLLARCLCKGVLYLHLLTFNFTKRKNREKVKWSRYRPGAAQRVGWGIALFFHDRGTRREWVVSSTPVSHFTPGKDPVPILQEYGWNPGPVWKDGKSHPHRDFIPGLSSPWSVAIPTELPGPILTLLFQTYITGAPSLLSSKSTQLVNLSITQYLYPFKQIHHRVML